MPVLEVRRDDPGVSRTVEEPERALDDGEVRFRIESFALTANNITYAVAGDMLGYWDFFPTADPTWGRVPAMGWAEVVESSNPDVPTGGRYYGWFPMADSLVTTVAATHDGLRDDGAHRLKHAPVYRSFVATDRDPFHQAGDDAEARHALLRGLFLTGYLADASLAAQASSAGQTVVLSASSKTAIGYADCAAARGVDVVGVTSAGNLEFVEGLECYAAAVAYDDVTSIEVAPSTVVDMAGNGAATAAVHAHLGDAIAASLTVGKSHHDAEAVPVPAGPEPQFFFAPTAIQDLVALKGAEAYQQDATAALHRFVGASTAWLTVERRSGPAAVEATWLELHRGSVPPSLGLIASQHP